MAFRPWTRLITLAVLALAGCGGGGSSGSGGGDGGAGGDGAGALTLSIDDASVAEGDDGTAKLKFTVTLSEPSAEAVKVSYETADDTARAGGMAEQGHDDYVGAAATLRFDPGETKQSFTITVNGDKLDEPDETVNVVLSKPLGATIVRGTGIGTIENDDAVAAQISIANEEVYEGDASTLDATLTVTLSQPSALPVTVHYASAQGTAVDGQDYAGVSGTLTFAPGETTQLVTVTVHGDTQQEPDETLLVRLSQPTNATLAKPDGLLTILNDDDSASPTLSIDDAAVSEGNFGTKLLTFTIKLSKASTGAVTVDYATIDDTATAGGVAAQGGVDYVTSSDSVTFAPGETSKQVDIVVNGDALNEANESFVVELFNGAGALVLDPQAVGTINNDDALPSVSVGNVSIAEGAAGTRTASFVVSLSSSSARAVSVSFSTENGTAVAGVDYAAASGTVMIGAGVTSAFVSVTVYGDLVDEASETFFVDLLGAQNASIFDNQGQGSIENDDLAPQATIDDVMLVEGDAGSKNAVFTVNLSTPSGQYVYVDWTTNDDTATAAQDYVAASGTLTFAPGVTTQPINVAVKGDVLDELNEAFSVDLSNASHCVISDDHGVGTIITDDSALPALNIDNAGVIEGNAGTVTLTLTVTLSAASAQQVKVNYAASDGTATSGTDYQAASGTLTFSPGQTFKTIDILVNGDTLHEPDETLLITLSNPVNAIVADGQGIGGINNDDTAPSLSIGDVSLAEGNAGTKQAVFTVSLSAASSFQVSASYATADGTAIESGSASVGQDDYEATSDVIVFAPGQTMTTISVPINGDVIPEGSETFVVQLSAPQNAAINDGQGQCTITNDDAIPSITIDDVSLLEGDAGTKTFTFTITLSGPSGSQVSVDYATANGTAFDPSDYSATSGTVVFAPGQTTGTLAVTVIGDKAPEAHKDETFFVDLSNPKGATIGDNRGLGTILSDD